MTLFSGSMDRSGYHIGILDNVVHINEFIYNVMSYSRIAEEIKVDPCIIFIKYLLSHSCVSRDL